MTRRISLSVQERDQKIALCEATYFKLNGSMPNAEVLCEMLGKDYLNDILHYLNAESDRSAGAA